MDQMNRMAGLFRVVLEAFAVGDALGMPTEFMTRDDIRTRFGLVDRLLDPANDSQNHPDLFRGQVTDDTEQVLVLIDEYCRKGRVDASDTAYRLLRWMRESGAIEKRYIGPSSRAALEAVERGENPAKTGMRGSTCGGIMRVPAAVLFWCSGGLAGIGGDGSAGSLEDAVVACCLPTHNTRPALEAAMGYAWALREALERHLDPDCEPFASQSPTDLFAAASAGAAEGRRRAPYAYCAPSLAARLSLLESIPSLMESPDALLDFLFDVCGTGLESIDVATAAISIARFCGHDAWLAIRMGASAGGDTDTIAALAGALCAAQAGHHAIPDAILAEVMSVNTLDMPTIAGMLAGSTVTART
jgi:ADP-ribosylglycohydrolase